MRALLFSRRISKEILRDPLSMIFCAAFPLVMLAVLHFTFYNEYAYWFELGLLTPGITVFSGSFIMLCESLIVSKDRSTSFLVRLYTSPMKTRDFIVGYTIPLMVVAFLQSVLCYFSAALMALIDGAEGINLLRALFASATTLPMMLAYISLGILFGSVFNDKAAPPMTSAVITGAGFLSAAWIPLETGSTLETVCNILPFYPATTLARTAISGTQLTGNNFWIPLVKTLAYAVVLFVLAIVAFKKNMTNDKK